MNKVLQAAGRLIRTPEDCGVLLLLDDRFFQSDYEPLFPREWKKRIVCDLQGVSYEIFRFWTERLQQEEKEGIIQKESFVKLQNKE